MSYGAKIAITLAAILIPFALFLSLVVAPSHTERRENCAAVGGVIIDGGVCVKRDSVLSY